MPAAQVQVQEHAVDRHPFCQSRVGIFDGARLHDFMPAAFEGEGE
jgi:hypothetical protein